MDQLIYKAVYDHFTVVPVGSCAQVAQLVKSFKSQVTLHWLHCAGLVDGDGRLMDEGVSKQGLHVLPVSEVENLLLIPDVFEALAKALSFDDDDVSVRLAWLKREVLDLARRDAERVSMKHTSARIWEASRSVGIKANNIADLNRLYDAMVVETDPEAIYRDCRSSYERMVESGNHEEILRLYDNKHGLLNIAARCLGLHGRSELGDLVARLVSRKGGDTLVTALRNALPCIDPAA